MYSDLRAFFRMMFAEILERWKPLDGFFHSKKEETFTKENSLITSTVLEHLKASLKRQLSS